MKKSQKAAELTENIECRPGWRWFDVIVSATAIPVLSPLLGAIAVAIKLSDGGPVFYRHARVGRDFRAIRVCKFRTMVPEADRLGTAITASNDPRITRLGKFLRRYKLDELPQLFNVLRGEMALVGPRPEVPEFVRRFPAVYGHLLRVRPGITDPASLALSNEEELLSGGDFEEQYASEILPKKLELSLGYLRRRTCRSDLMMLFQTLARIFLPGVLDRARRLRAQRATPLPRWIP